MPYNKDEMQCILDDVNNSLNNEYLPAECIIHTHDVKSAVARLKAHKNDGGSSLSTDHFTNAGDDCLTHISLLFTAIIIHGAVHAGQLPFKHYRTDSQRTQRKYI